MKITESQFDKMIDEKRIEILADAIDPGTQPRCDYTDQTEVEEALIDDMVGDGILTESEAESISTRAYFISCD